MANLLTVSLATLVDRALRDVRNQHEVGKPTALSAAINSTETQLTLTAEANETDTLEFGSELMLVTVKSSDPTPVYTVIRGYFDSTAASHASGAAGLINPTFTRRAATDGVMRSLSAIDSTRGLRLLKTEEYTPVPDPFDVNSSRFVIEVPSETRDVWYVRLGLDEVPRWRFYDNVATATYSTGKVVRSPCDDSAALSVTREVPLRWSSHPADPAESDTVELYEGAEWLPSCYATAYLLAGREYSRTDLDRSEEFGRTEPVRDGVSRSIVRDAWQTFYRKLDEARRLDTPMPTRPFVGYVR